jgi:hypothetical protein
MRDRRRYLHWLFEAEPKVQGNTQVVQLVQVVNRMTVVQGSKVEVILAVAILAMRSMSDEQLLLCARRVLTENIDLK